MPIFVAWLANAFVALFAWFGKDTVRKLGAAAGVVVVIAGFFAGLLFVVDGILDSISVVMPSILTTVCTWVVPNNFEACVSARLTAEVAIAVYKWKRDIALAGAAA